MVHPPRAMDVPRISTPLPHTMISNGVDIRGISMDTPRISTRYIMIRGISMDIHGISFDLYPWYIRGISMDIPRFLNPDFPACPCCCSLSMRTPARAFVGAQECLFHCTLLLSPRQRRLALCCSAGRRVGDQECLFHAPPWQLCQLKRRATKVSPHPFPLRRRRGGRRRLALRGPAGRLSYGRLGGLILAILPQCVFAIGVAAAAVSSAAAVSAAVPSPPPSAAAAAAAAMAAAQASFLAESCSMISFFVSIGADGAGPSGLVRSVTYWMRTCWKVK
jgi:hypothetical protein